MKWDHLYDYNIYIGHYNIIVMDRYDNIILPIKYCNIIIGSEYYNIIYIFNLKSQLKLKIICNQYFSYITPIFFGYIFFLN